MVKKNKSKKNNNKIKIKGGFWRDIENLSLLIPKLNKVKNNNKKSKKNKLRGGFIRAGSSQHF